jgi:hypothetical protein
MEAEGFLQPYRQLTAMRRFSREKGKGEAGHYQ